MNEEVFKLVTIIGEEELEEGILDRLNKLGVTGYTISRVQGHGSRKLRSSEINEDNIKIETLVTSELCQKIMNEVATEYFEHYSIICYACNIDVVRSNKYKS